MRLRLAFLLLLGLLLAIAAGCGGGEEVTPTPDNEVPAATSGADTGTDTGGETETGGGAPPTPAAARRPAAVAAATPRRARRSSPPRAASTCHTLADAGATGTVGPNLDEAKPDTALVTARVTNGKGADAVVQGPAHDQQIADVAAYVVKAPAARPVARAPGAFPHDVAAFACDLDRTLIAEDAVLRPRTRQRSGVRAPPAST